MTDDNRAILRGCLQLLAMPFMIWWAALVWIPFLVIRKVVRWYQLPRHQREAINAESRRRREAGWEQVESCMQRQLRAHGLMDMPENRVRINSTMQKRRR
jgi:hypothetical protein